MMAQFVPAFLLLIAGGINGAAIPDGKGGGPPADFDPNSLAFLQPHYTKYVTNETQSKLCEHIKDMIIEIGDMPTLNKMCDCMHEEGRKWLPSMMIEVVGELNLQCMILVANELGLDQSARMKRSALRLKRQAEENSAVGQLDMVEMKCERLNAGIVGMYGVCAKEANADLSFASNIRNAELMCQSAQEIFNTFGHEDVPKPGVPAGIPAEFPSNFPSS